MQERGPTVQKQHPREGRDANGRCELPKTSRALSDDKPLSDGLVGRWIIATALRDVNKKRKCHSEIAKIDVYSEIRFFDNQIYLQL